MIDGVANVVQTRSNKGRKYGDTHDKRPRTQKVLSRHATASVLWSAQIGVSGSVFPACVGGTWRSVLLWTARPAETAPTNNATEEIGDGRTGALYFRHRNARASALIIGLQVRRCDGDLHDCPRQCRSTASTLIRHSCRAHIQCDQAPLRAIF